MVRKSRFALLLILLVLAGSGPLTLGISEAAEIGKVVGTVQSSGNGGTESRDLCPEGQVLTEISGNPLEWYGYKTVTKINGNCFALNDDGDGVGFEVTATPRRGNFKSSNFKTAACPDGSAIIGAEVYKTVAPGFYVAGITLKCGRLPSGEVKGKGESLGYVTGQSEQLNCPAKSVATGLIVRYGDIIDVFGLVCSTIGGVSQNAITSVNLSPDKKTYPYEADVEVEDIKGGSGSGRVSIIGVADGSDGMKCRLNGKRLTAEKPGKCILTIQKSGDANFKSARATASFEFTKLPLALTVQSLGATSKKYPYSQSLEIALDKNDYADQVVFTVSDGTAKNCVLSDGSAKAILTATTSGTCLIKANFSESSNYVAEEIEPTAFNFEKAELTVVAPTLPVGAGQTPDAITPSFTGFIEGEDENSPTFKEGLVLPTCVVENADDPENSSINCSGGEASNYIFNYTSGKLILDSANSIQDRSQLIAYDPISEPEKTVDIQVAAFALLTVAAAGAGVLSQSSQPQSNQGSHRGRKEDENQDGGDGDKESDREAGDIASTDSGKLAFHKKSTSWGDNSILWKIAHREKFDNRFKSWSEKLSPISPVASRIFLDGSYLRAMFSALAIIPSIAALVVAGLMLKVTNFQALPATFTLLAIAVALSILDSFAGLVMAVVVGIGVLVSGNAGSLDEAMTLVGIAALLLTPGLIVSSIRPLRRIVSDTGSFWERITDYFLGVLLGGWALEKLVSALNGLAGVQLPIASHARELGLIASAFILLRFLLEDFAAHFFPARLELQAAEVRSPNSAQPWVSLMLKTLVFYLVAYQFLGLTTQLLIGTFVFALPSIVKNLVGNKSLPKSKIVFRILPKGAMKVVIMVFVGGFFADNVKRLFSNPADFVTWSFVVLAIPGLVLSLAGIFATSPQRDWKESGFGTLVYRVGGIAIALLIVAMYQGVDLYGSTQEILGNFDLGSLFDRNT